MADHYTLIERQHRNSRGYEIEWELWGGLDLRDPRAGRVTGDLIEIYDDDERDDARMHCKALNYDLTTDLLAWLANPLACHYPTHQYLTKPKAHHEDPDPFGSHPCSPDQSS